MPSTLRPLRFAASLALLAALPAAEPAPPAEMPPGFQPCRIIRQEPAHFPPRMFQEGIARGEAHVVVEVGLDGTLTDSLIVLYTHRAFADEALRVARASRYAAGTINGQPFISILQLQFHFDTERMVVTQHVGLNPEPPEPRTSRFEYHAQTLAALDRRPNALHTPGPVYPQAWIDAGRRGTITVAFYLDEQGRVRLPVARDPHDELLAASACAAVKDWRFEPPLRRGKPVLVRVELPIVFHPEATASPPRSD